MRKLLVALGLLLASVISAAAQCTGIFPASTICGSLNGGFPGPVPLSPSPFNPIFNTLGIVNYPFTLKGGSTESGHEGYDLYVNSQSDAISNNGSGTAQEFPPQWAIGYNRNSSLDTGSVLYLERLATNPGGTGPWQFNANDFALRVQAGWPAASSNIGTATAITTTGGTSAGYHAPQNSAIIVGQGQADTVLEVDAYGGMIHGLYVLAENIGGSGTIYPKYIAQLTADQASSDSIGLDIVHDGIPYGGELFGISNSTAPGYIFEITGPKNAPGGTVTAGGAYADVGITGNLGVGGVISITPTGAGADLNLYAPTGYNPNIGYAINNTFYWSFGTSLAGAEFQFYDNVNNITSIGIFSGISSAGYVDVGYTTASTSTSTGALVDAGGLGVAGTAYIGGLLHVTSTVTSAAHTIYSSSANALAVGQNGSTNPAFNVDASTTSQVAGLDIVGAAIGGTVAIKTTDSGSANNLTINALGTGTIGIGTVSTGAVTIGATAAISWSDTATSGSDYGLNLSYTVDPAGSSTASNKGINALVNLTTNQSVSGAMQAISATAENSGTSTVTTAVGISAGPTNASTGTITNARNQFLVQNTGGGTVTNAISVEVFTPTGATTGLTSTWTNTHGIEIQNQNPSGAGTNTLTNAPIALLIDSQTATGAYAIQQAGSGLNSFAGATTFSSSLTNSGIASTAQADVVCTTSAGLFSYQISATGCAASSERFKNMDLPMLDEEKIHLANCLTTVKRWTYKDPNFGDPSEYVGFTAEQVAACDDHFITYDDSGLPYAVKHQQLAETAIAGFALLLRQQQAEIEVLKTKASYAK